jgi:diadenylate cyclase
MPDSTGLFHLFARRPLGLVVTDIADLLIVTYVVYRALLVLRGTRAMQMGTGLGLIFLVYLAAKSLSLVTLLNLLSTLLSSIILIVVVVFQNDIRRGLMRVGSRAFLGGFARAQESKVIDEVVAAATELARHRMGALIAFEQDANLDEFVVAQGIPVDSAVTRELMVSLFVPESVNKLHDGAVIIRNLRIAKAGVFFPMPESRIVDTSLGSRHRAALGITEETDAVVVVVSEERGTISFCFSGNIVSNLDGASLRQALLGLFGRKPKKKGRRIPTPGGGRPSVVPPRPSALPPETAPVASTDLVPPSSRGAPMLGVEPIRLPTPLPTAVPVGLRPADKPERGEMTGAAKPLSQEMPESPLPPRTGTEEGGSASGTEKAAEPSESGDSDPPPRDASSAVSRPTPSEGVK